MQSRGRHLLFPGPVWRHRSIMAETSYVTVAKYSVALEAQLAKSLLETEDIPAQVTGDLAATMIGISSLGQQVHVQVPAEDAERAATLLASHFAKAQLDEDWQE